MRNRQIEYLAHRRGNGEVWFIDCTLAINIKFMSCLGRANLPVVLGDFYCSTIEAFRAYIGVY